MYFPNAPRTRKKNPALAARMAELGFTGKRLATAAGLSRVTVSCLLNQRREPTRATASRIAAALQTTPAELGFVAKGGDAV